MKGPKTAPPPMPSPAFPLYLDPDIPGIRPDFPRKSGAGGSAPCAGPRRPCIPPHLHLSQPSRGGLDDRGTKARKGGPEESPDSMKKGCRVTPGGGNPRESATEKSLPWCHGTNSARRRPGASAKVMVKRWGKSPPRTWQQGRYGKPHPEQCRIGALPRKGPAFKSGNRLPETSARELQPEGPGRQLDPVGNGGGRGMVIHGGQPPGQNPAYRPSAQIIPGLWRAADLDIWGPAPTKPNHSATRGAAIVPRLPDHLPPSRHRLQHDAHGRSHGLRPPHGPPPVLPRRHARNPAPEPSAPQHGTQRQPRGPATG
jgi:hypothetical protein